MKAKLLLTAAFALLFALPAFAQIAPLAPQCVRGTLASYIALGAEGCTFDSVLYDNFTYASPVLNAITPAEIVVTPILLPVAGLSPGLNFSAPWSVAAGKSEISVIGFKAVPFPPNAADILPLTGTLTLDLGLAKVSGIVGSVTVEEKTSVASTAAPLEVYEICEDACTIKERDSVTVSGIQILQTTITVSLSGGTGGASLESFASDYAFGPQPE
jgi:hypothetical protein